MSATAPKYRLRFFFDFGLGGPCLWADNPDTRSRFDYCVDLHELPLTQKTITEAEKIGAWFDQSLNWNYPPDPGPWRQDECERFNRACRELLQRFRVELGDEFELIDQQREMVEDPDLDAYLANPKGFRRKH